ncbi:nuclear fragile X mental retardation-interacting protein 1 isoform X1 [Channa argus]|uniref:nuclear fragile X mental retardation-interacting protein 1 isoform X1 n=1 Tax=Channa argus TaxID=215402 RepID=UPI00352056FF
MSEPGHYPPPDFSRSPSNSIQPFQQQPRSSSFHPSMWNWCETSSDSNWDYSGQTGWHRGAATGFGYQSGRANYATKRPYGQNYGHEWHQGGYQGGRQNYGSSSNHGKKQKNKKEPEYSHFCDTCDRGFKNQEKYDEHVSQHVKCSVPDCNFKAHEKIVNIHWKNNHAPGAKIIKLDTPEEIAKWREERRKNFPTLQNIEKKNKLMEVRKETGGILETAQFGRMRGRGRGRGRGQRWGNRGFQQRHQQGPQPSIATERPPPLSRPCRDEDPLGALASGYYDSDSEDTAAESRKNVLVVAPKQMSSALGSLVANYGSMSESESDEEPECTLIQKAKDLVQENQVLLHTIPAGSQDTSMNSSSWGREINKVPQPDSARYTPNSRRGRGRGRGRGGRHQDTPQKHRATLLEMLLAPDIRHERNILLQCVRYIVRNNFFGLESRAQLQEEFKTPPPKEIRVVPQFASSPCVERCSAQSAPTAPDVSKEEGLQRHGTVVVEQNLAQNYQEQICFEQTKDHTVESASSAEQVAEGFILNAKGTTGTECNSLDLTVTHKITSAFNLYDDEIWESPGGVM